MRTFSFSEYPLLLACHHLGLVDSPSYQSLVPSVYDLPSSQSRSILDDFWLHPGLVWFDFGLILD